MKRFILVLLTVRCTKVRGIVNAAEGGFQLLAQVVEELMDCIVFTHTHIYIYIKLHI